jgi:hypothetical protein
MTYRGTVRNGVVVFAGARRPTEGSSVEVRPLPAAAAARKGAGNPKRSNASKPAPPRGKAGRRSAKGQGQSSVDRVAQEQGVTRIVPFDELLGGWPHQEEQDGFEEAVARWRAEEPRRGEF